MINSNKTPSTGALKLEKYLKEIRKSKRSFAIGLNIWPERLHRLLKGTARPTLVEACKISDAIPHMDPHDWLPSDEK